MRSRSAIASAYSASVTPRALSMRAGDVGAVLVATSGEELRVGVRGLAVLDRRRRSGTGGSACVEAHLDDVGLERGHRGVEHALDARARARARAGRGRPRSRWPRARPARDPRAPRRAASRPPGVRAIGPAWSSERASGIDAVRAQQAVRGLQAGDAAERGGDADRAAGVGAERERRLAESRAPRAEPPLLPPGTRSGSCGFRHGGKCGFTLVMPHANSCVSVLPTTIAPASRAFATDHGVGVRHVPGEDARPVRRAHAVGVEQVLDRERRALPADARCRPCRPARRPWPPPAPARA